MDFDGLARSSLRRASDDWKFLNMQGHERTSVIKWAQSCAESALRAILFHYNIRLPKTHDLDEIAKNNSRLLHEIWTELQPQLHTFEKLFTWRNIVYHHNDSPPVVNHPSIGTNWDKEAYDCAKIIYEIAVRVVDKQ
ncbi:HEPN domain-containing protein [Cohnella cellulosilytica]|uniref:HEPN domain-containing protein n=1 Tax=Cohnella cellulosilytica TaxID=986710 RepID=A0ABW2FAI1_9BACL